MAGKSVFYWDSCAFLALLKKESQHGADELPALEHMAADFDQGLIYLATSTISLLEVLSADLEEVQREQFEGVIQRSNFVIIEASEPIMRVAAQIRRHYYGKVTDGDNKPLIVSSPDAIHVASAIALPCEEMITLDCRNKPNKREMGLLQLGAVGKILDVHPMPICKPSYGKSGNLFYGQSEPKA